MQFLSGFDAAPNLKALAEDLPAGAWQPLPGLPNYLAKAPPRQRPDSVKEAIVVAREFENRRLAAEAVAEFAYRPTACRQTYRMVVVRKNISVLKGEQVLFDDVRYFFCLTNITALEPPQVVWVANNRCNQA